MATFDSIPPDEGEDEERDSRFGTCCDVCGKMYPHHDTTAHLLKAPEVVKQGLVFLLTRIASWTNARWDQHLRERYGDKHTDDIIEWMHKHEIYAGPPSQTAPKQTIYECSNCGALNKERSGPCEGCKLTSPPRTETREAPRTRPDENTTWERACRTLERLATLEGQISRDELHAIREVTYRVRLFSNALTWLEENIPSELSSTASGIQLVARALVHGEAGARR